MNTENRACKNSGGAVLYVDSMAATVDEVMKCLTIETIMETKKEHDFKFHLWSTWIRKWIQKLVKTIS